MTRHKLWHITLNSDPEVQMDVQKVGDELQKLAKSHPPKRVDLPVQFSFALQRAKWKVGGTGGGQRLHQQSLGVLSYPVDAPSVLKEFLELPRGDLSLLSKFLSRYGLWDEGTSFLVSMFWAEQDHLKEFLGLPLVEQQLKAIELGWLGRTFACSLGVVRESGRGIPVLTIRLRTIMDAIMASAQIEALVRGAPWKKCKRPDCNVWFQCTHKGKEYHDQYCGHLESLRASRRRKAKTSLTGKKSTRKGGSR